MTFFGKQQLGFSNHQFHLKIIYCYTKTALLLEKLLHVAVNKILPIIPNNKSTPILALIKAEGPIAASDIY